MCNNYGLGARTEYESGSLLSSQFLPTLQKLTDRDRVCLYLHRSSIWHKHNEFVLCSRAEIIFNLTNLDNHIILEKDHMWERINPTVNQTERLREGCSINNGLPCTCLYGAIFFSRSCCSSECSSYFLSCAALLALFTRFFM